MPYPAGGQTDGIARSFGDFLSRKLGQTVVVENKGGAGGTIGCAEVKRAAPDGYTILCTISSSLIQNRVTVKDLPYDPEKDFTYLTMTTSIGGPVVAAEKTGATNLKQFVEYAKKVDKVNWGAYGPGSTPHVLIETMASSTGFKVEVVQYRGEAAMFADLTAAAARRRVGQPGRGGAGDRLRQGQGHRRHRRPAAGLSRRADDDGAGRGRRLLRDAGVRRLRRPGRDAQGHREEAHRHADRGRHRQKVKQLLANYLIVGPLSFEATNARFKRDTEVMLAVLKEIGLKPE